MKCYANDRKPSNDNDALYDKIDKNKYTFHIYTTSRY